jgi:hypothetical protein
MPPPFGNMTHHEMTTAF